MNHRIRRHSHDLPSQRRRARLMVLLAGIILVLGLTGMAAGLTFSPGHIASAGIALITAIAALGMLGIGISNLREADALEREERLARERREGGAGSRLEELVASAQKGGRRKDLRTVVFITALAVGIAFAFIGAIFVIPGPHDHLVEPERLEALYREAVMEAEREFGRTLRREVPLRIMSRRDMWSRGYPGKAFAAYVPQDGLIAVIPSNVIWHRGDGEDREIFVTPSYFRFLLIHEVVHALDDQYFAAASGTSEANLVQDALLEGHAQHLAFRACERRGDGKWLKRYAAVLEGIPEGNHKFKYWHAKLFFDRLAERDPDLDVGRIYDAPPPHPEYILNPDAYLAAREDGKLESEAPPAVLTSNPPGTPTPSGR